MGPILNTGHSGITLAKNLCDLGHPCAIGER